jgi:hypothetical protein
MFVTHIFFYIMYICTIFLSIPIHTTSAYVWFSAPLKDIARQSHILDMSSCNTFITAYRITDASVSPSGRFVIGIINCKTIFMYDTYKHVYIMKQHLNHNSRRIAFVNDAQCVCMGDSNIIYIYDILPTSLLQIKKTVF